MAVVFAIGIVAMPASSRGDEAATLVVYIEGAEADALEKVILDKVPENVAVVPTDAFRNALRSAGWPGPMGNAIAVRAVRAPLIRATKRAMKTLGATHALLGRVRKTRTLDTEVWLLFVESNDANLQLDEAVPVPKNEADRFAALRAALARPFDVFTPPSPPPEAPAPAPVVQPERIPPPSPRTDRGQKAETAAPRVQTPSRLHEVGSALFTFALGYEVAGREFGYDQPMSLNLRPYHVLGAHLVVADGELYPLATTNVSFLSDVGVYANYGIALGLQSAVKGGEAIGTEFDRFDAGIRARIHTGGPGAPLLGLRAGFGWLRFEFDDASGIEDELPSVWYQFLHAGVDARFPIGPVAILAGADYLGPLVAGPVEARFGNARLWGVNARAGMAVRLFSGFEGRVAADYMTFGYKFSSQPTDLYAAAGARDQLFGLQFLIAYVD